MTEEREIVGIALPLALGIAAGSYTRPMFSYITSGTFAFILLAISVFQGKRKIARPYTNRFFLVFLCGVICTDISFRCESSRLPEDGNCLRKLADKASQSILTMPFDDQRSAPLLTALITGNKDKLTQKTKNAFRDSGASHLLALSGLHLGIIYLVLSRLLSVLGNSLFARGVRSVTVILFSACYTLATGASPSLTRAFIFIALKEISKMSGRPQKGSQIVISALTLQLLARPQSLFSLGFQLSYLAVAGIIYINPILEKCWTPEDKGIMKKIWETATVSISCQVATAPLVWHTFGTFPEHFLLTNLIAIPITSVLIPAAIGSTVLHHFGHCPDFLVRTIDKTCTALTDALETIASM